MLIDLSEYRWQLTGWRPLIWKYARVPETTFWVEPEFGPLEGHLPGSVQENLRRAGVLPDWHDGLNSRAVEWVEHRHWMFETELPEMEGAAVFVAESLDYAGWVLVNRRVAGTFRGPHRPAEIDLASAWGDEVGPRRLAIVFGTPPEVHGQVGYTSETRELKPRFNYSWDWCPRFVPSGARGALLLVPRTENAVCLIGVRTELEADLQTARVVVRMELPAGCEVGMTLDQQRPAGASGSESLRLGEPAGPTGVEKKFAASTGANEFVLEVAAPALWWPSGQGDQVLYELKIEVRDGAGLVVRTFARTVGFKHVAWRACEGAPAGARPWICVVNGRPVFLQGVNWTPARMAYQDVTREEIDRLVGLYREMGCNLLRVWGGASLESEEFYDACDRAGLLVWQEFPLSSSGLDSVPPRDADVIGELREVARHFVRARQHHACLLMWCGGNELQEGYEDGDWAKRHPCDESQPCLAAFAEVVAEEDPGRRYLPTSPSGPSFLGKRESFGKGVHHHVHGPWGLGDFKDLEDWRDYWTKDDALFRSEVGVPGCADLELLRRHADGQPLWPLDTPLWRHAANWWTQEQRFAAKFAPLPPDESLAAYVEHTRREQAEGLAIAARACKARFPRCGGFIVWMGHDCFPCPSNTSVIDFAGQPKPAWYALKEVFATD
jgi:beta-mannosidase